ncbi:MAG TPA: hypothetical protein VGH82_06245 [Gaiellaceae bacterium]
MSRHEVIGAEQVSAHDRIVVATSGHSGGMPDCPVEVIRVTGAGRPVLWIRLPDGRTSVYVPGRTVYRIAETDG